MRTEERYHGFFRTIGTVWKVRVVNDCRCHGLLIAYTATRRGRILRWRVITPLAQGAQLRDWLGGIRGHTHVHADGINTISQITRRTLRFGRIYLFIALATYLLCLFNLLTPTPHPTRRTARLILYSWSACTYWRLYNFPSLCE